MPHIVRRFRRPPALLAVAAIGLFLFAADPGARAETGRVSLRISSGGSLISPRELNDYLKDFVRSYQSLYGLGISHDTTRTFSWARDFELALDIPLRHGLFLSAAAGLISATREGNAFTIEWGTVGEDVVRDDRIRSLAFRLGLAYDLTLSRRLSLRPHGGFDAYWTFYDDSGSRTSHYEGWGDNVNSWTAQTQAFNLGGTIGLALEATVFKKLGLFLDAGYRLARLSGFSGSYQETYNGAPEEPVEFRLLYYEESEEWLGTSFKRFNLPGGWGGGTIAFVHEAVIDLSGFFLKAGLRVSF